MKRYYICDIIGDGTQENSYRPSIALENVNWTAIMPANNPVTGAPVKQWALVIVGAQDHSSFETKPGIDALPVQPLHMPLFAIAREALRTKLIARGIRPDVVDRNEMREVLRDIGREIEPAFSENQFDVLDE